MSTNQTLGSDTLSLMRGSLAVVALLGAVVFVAWQDLRPTDSAPQSIAASGPVEVRVAVAMAKPAEPPRGSASLGGAPVKSKGEREHGLKRPAGQGGSHAAAVAVVASLSH
jgi:hypothetical protein